MKYCQNCGSKINDNVVFCIRCGNFVSKGDTLFIGQNTKPAGFIIGIINFVNAFLLYLFYRNKDILPDDRSAIIIAWLVVIIVLAITGFCLSMSAYKNKTYQKGFDIAGIVLNSLIILPAFVFLALLLVNSKYEGTKSNSLSRRKNQLY